MEQSAVLLHKCRNGRNQFKQLETVSVPNSRNSKHTDMLFLWWQSPALCIDSDEHVFETRNSLSGQGHSFILDTASRHPLNTHADLLKFYPNAKPQPMKKKVMVQVFSSYNFLLRPLSLSLMDKVMLSTAICLCRKEA